MSGKTKRENTKKINKKFIVAIVLLVSVACVFITPCFINNENTSKYINDMHTIAEIISCFFVIAGTFIAVWQYYLNSKTEKIKLNKENVQKAIDLASYYKDNILKNYLVIKSVYRNAGITSVLDNIKAKDMIAFDEKELKDIFSEKQLNELQRLQNDKKFAAAVMAAAYIYGLDISKGNINEEIDNIKIIQDFVNKIVLETLNNMEYFSMHFNYNTADEDIVYQSLHQTYLEITRTLYYNIAKENKMDSERYYTNVVALYNLWNKKKETQVKKITDNNRKSVVVGKKVDELD